MSQARRIQLLFATAFALITLFISAILITIWGLRSDAIRDAGNDSSNIAAVLAGQIARSIQSVDLVLTDVRRNAASLVGASDDIAPLHGYQQFEELNNHLRRIPQANIIALVGRDGQVVNSTTQWPSTGTDVSDRDYFVYLRHVTDDRLYISNLVKNRVTGESTLFFGRRISGPDKEFFGVAIVGVKISYFESIYESITSLRSQSFLLLHSDGTMLMRSPAAPLRGNNKITKGSSWYSVVAAGGGSYRSPGYFDNEARLVSVAPLKEYPLVVNVAVRESAALENWRRRALSIGVGSSLGVVCSLILLWRLRRQFSRLMSSEAALAARERALAERSRDLERLFETSLDIIIVTNNAGDILTVSPIVSTILGYYPAEMIGKNAKDFMVPEDVESARYEMREASGGTALRNFEARYLHRNGNTIVLSWTGVWSEPDQKYYFTGRDVTADKAIEQRLTYLAHFDQLTELPNRVSLHNDFEAALRLSEFRSTLTAVALFDLDGFKDINDTLGHSVGDLLLKVVASRLAFSEEDGRFYRLGGDEFVLMKPECANPQEFNVAVDAAIERLAVGFEVKGHRLFVSASAGIAIAPSDGLTAEELLSNADLALYAAKAAGGSCSKVYASQMRVSAQAKRALDIELRQAVDNREFALFYQPQVRAKDGVTVGAEALLRWRHPERGLLSPAAFLDALSEGPSVLDVGRWILRTACTQAAQWRADGLPIEHIGVNLFPAQYRAKNLVSDVSAALAESGLPPSALEIEITENIALHEEETVAGVLQDLRTKGVNLAFDDFGTGYASLSYLTRYPLTRVKIDQTFVQKIDEISSDGQGSIVRSIILMARSLGLAVTAEGVETAAQAAFLRGENCDEMQGYLFAKPMPADEFAEFLKAGAKPTDRPRTGHRARHAT